MPDYDLIAILGPTASGKTPFAAALAYELNTIYSVLPANDFSFSFLIFSLFLINER